MHTFFKIIYICFISHQLKQIILFTKNAYIKQKKVILKNKSRIYHSLNTRNTNKVKNLQSFHPQAHPTLNQIQSCRFFSNFKFSWFSLCIKKLKNLITMKMKRTFLTIHGIKKNCKSIYKFIE